MFAKLLAARYQGTMNTMKRKPLMDTEYLLNRLPYYLVGFFFHDIVLN